MSDKTPGRAAILRAAASRRTLRSGLPLVVGGLCLWLLREKLAGLDFHAVTDVVRHTSALQWVAALLATAVSFWAIGTYDAVLHRHLRTGVPARMARITGAGSIAIAQVLGMGIVTGALARWRMLQGTSPKQAAALTGAVSASFLIAWAVLAVAAACFLPGKALPILFTPLVLALIIGLPALSLLRPNLRIGGFSLRLPSLRSMGAILMLTALDLAAAAAALHVMLPPEMAIGYHVLLPAFVIALGAGLFSSTPGGAGPFELTLLALMPGTATEPLLGAILGWRLVYYGVPALLALLPMAFPYRIPDAPEHFAPSEAQIARAPRAETGLARQNGGQALYLGSASALTVDTGQSLVMMFDPMNGTACQSMLTEFEAEAARRMLTPAIYKCGAPLAVKARQRGWAVLHVSDEAVVDVPGFTLDTPAHRQLRRKLRHAEKAGVTVRMADLSEPGLAEALAEIDAGWCAHHGGARGFSMGRFDVDYLRHQALFVAEKDGAPIAFTSFHAGAREMVLDLMRHGADLPDGTMYLLIAAAIEEARARALPRLSLAAMPPDTSREPERLQKMRARVACRSGGDGLTRFKTAFAPRREPLYLCAPGAISLALTAGDLALEVRRGR
ncbi:phosphatidylglycerol lysyltransferase domain-containing protein [Pseudooceanicola sp. C21-150M6]|uniref:phosphatidylglycerol lysyltransferase domain-containing protein n=1 Tax=Pseudooceanicola sp. C21-150M6 TaxID=3434355 RepID=UPI003D7F4934